MGINWKRLQAIFLSCVMVTGLGHGYGTYSEVKAAEIDLTGVTVQKTIQNGGDNAIKAALQSQTYTIDGLECNNYSLYDGVKVNASNSIGDNTASKMIDGKTDTRWETEHGVDPQDFTVNFGNVYEMKYIYIFWEGASAKEYDVEVSADGVNFQSLTSVTSNNGERTDALKLSSAIGVRAVRVNCKSRTTQYGDSIWEIGFFGTTPQQEAIPMLSDLRVQDYYKYTGKYLIYFSEPTGAAGYNVYLDDATTPVKTIKNSGAYLSKTDLEGYAQGQHKISVASVDTTGAETAKISTTFSITDTPGTYSDMPQVYISTLAEITRDYQPDVTVSFVDKDGGAYADVIDGKCNVKIRGNTTSGAPKKPYNVKLNKKQALFGIPKAKKWCLLANSFDKSLIRNSLALNFGLQNGVTYNSESRYVEVYVNGVFNGSYLLTEAVQAKENRVEIDAYNATNNEVLLELGHRAEETEVDYFVTDVLGTTFDINDPEKDDDLANDLVYEKIARVKTYIEQFEQALKRNNYDEILQYIDEDTFINFYIANEYFKNVDFNFSSTRFYIKGDKIYAGPMWDFDLSSGNCKTSFYQDYYVDGVSWKGYYCQSMTWYRELLKNQTFYNKIKERFAQLQYQIQNIYKANSAKELSVRYLVDTYGASFERNYAKQSALGAGWSLTNEDGYSYAAESGWKTWREPIDFLQNWLEHRNEWLCEQWNVNMQEAYNQGIPEGDNDETLSETTQQQTTKTNPGGNYNPGFDPSSLNYQEIKCTGSENTVAPILYAQVDGATIAGIVPWYGDGGVTFMIQYADPNGEGANATVTINGTEPERDAVTEKVQGLVKFNPTTFDEDAYTVVNIKLESSKELTFVIKKGEPQAIETTPETTPETTTQSKGKLTKPRTATINDNKVLSWQPVQNAQYYLVKVDGVEVGTTVATRYELANEFTESKRYSIAVIAVAEGYENSDEGMVQYNYVVPTTTEAATDPEEIETTVPELTTPAKEESSATEEESQKETSALNETSADVEETTAITTKENEQTSKQEETENPYDLLYEEIPCIGAQDIDPIEYALKDTDVDGVQVWYGDGGNTFTIQYSDTESEGIKAAVKVNGEDATAGVVRMAVNGMTMINPNELPNQEQNEITIELPSGKSITFILKTKVEETQEIITTTVSGEQKTTAEENETGENITTSKKDETINDDTTPAENVTTTKEESTTKEPQQTNVDETESIGEATSAATETDATEQVTTGEGQTTTDGTTTGVEIPTTSEVITTPQVSITTEKTTTKAVETQTKETTDKASDVKGQVKKAIRKKAAKKIKVSLKKVANAAGYQIAISYQKKFAKKATMTKTVKMVNVKLKLKKKFIKKKKLFIRVRAYQMVAGKKVYGAWSKPKKVKTK